LQQVLKANPDLTQAQKQAIGAWAAAFVGAAAGGTQGAAASLDNYNYNYLDHADNDKLNAAKAACDKDKSDQAACADKAQLEAKDQQQQQAYLNCRNTGYGGAGCTQVLATVVAALSSYAGTASYWASGADQASDVRLLKSSGGLDQILKIMAPNGVDKLTSEDLDHLSRTIGLLVSDPLAFFGLPNAIYKASNGDPAAMAQVIALATRLKLFGSGALGEISDSVANTEGSASYIPGVEGDVYTPSGSLYGQMKSWSCTAAACKMAGGLDDVSEADIRTVLGTAESGTVMETVPDNLKALGFDGTATFTRDLSIEQIQQATENGKAVIVSVESGTVAHSIVVDGIADGRVLIRDPSPEGIGSSYSLTIDQFQKTMTGRGIVLGN
jgi:hypothetical protein